MKRSEEERKGRTLTSTAQNSASVQAVAPLDIDGRESLDGTPNLGEGQISKMTAFQRIAAPDWIERTQEVLSRGPSGRYL